MSKISDRQKGVWVSLRAKPVPRSFSLTTGSWSESLVSSYRGWRVDYAPYVCFDRAEKKF